jgi:hypothetical protein
LMKPCCRFVVGLKILSKDELRIVCTAARKTPLFAIENVPN